MSRVVYTDGSCSPNPGNGGWAFVVLDLDGNVSQVSSGREKNTTNNRMELTAIIEAIKFLSAEEKLVIHTDSQLSMKCAKREWKRKMNHDLWKKYDEVSKGRNITFIKVKAHNGDRYNEMVDKLAKQGN